MYACVLRRDLSYALTSVWSLVKNHGHDIIICSLLNSLDCKYIAVPFYNTYNM